MDNVRQLFPKDDKRETTKKVVSYVAQIGAYIIVGGIAKQNVSPGRLPKKVAVFLAVVTLGGAASRPVNKEARRLVDLFYAGGQLIKESWDEAEPRSTRAN